MTPDTPSLDLTAVRVSCPYSESRVYLNTAAAGLSWTGQADAAAAFYTQAKRQGINGRDQWQIPAKQAAQRVRHLLGVGHAGQLEFTSSTTASLNLVADSLIWHAGDEIVMLADEFPSLAAAWERARRDGAIVRHVLIDDEAQRTDALCAAVTESTRVVAVSHVHWSTGTVVDLPRLGKRCREVGALLMVDGIQAMGAIPLDLRHVDIYCGAVFKWLLSGFGLAALWISDRTTSRLRPAWRGYANPPPSTSLGYAHVNYPGLYVLDATLAWLDSLGWTSIHAHLRARMTQLCDGMTALGYACITPHAPDARAGIASFAVNDAEAHKARLAATGIDVEVRDARLRVSPWLYTSAADIDALLDAMKHAA